MSNSDPKTSKKLNEEELAQATGGAGDTHRDDVMGRDAEAEVDNSVPLPGHITHDDMMGRTTDRPAQKTHDDMVGN